MSLPPIKNLRQLLVDLLPDQEIPDMSIKQLVLDSRQLTAGDMLIAVQGSRAHGLDFMATIKKSHPAVILYQPTEKYSELVIEGVVCLAIDNLQKHVSLIASRYYNSPSEKMQITAITGTNGKTTCAYLLAQLLVAQGVDAAIIGTTGVGRLNALESARLTTPDAINLQRILSELQDSGVEHVVMEASSHALDQYRLAAVQVDVAAFTNLSQDHLDYHADMHEYLMAKAKLFQFRSLRAAVINSDQEAVSILKNAVSEGVQVITYSLAGHRANLRAHNIETDVQGLSFELHQDVSIFNVKSSLLGQFNVANLLLVLSVMSAYGYAQGKIAASVSHLQAPCGRLERIGSATTPTVVIDYAHTPDALDKAFSTLKQLSQKKLATVFGCGGDRDKSKRAVMGAIAQQYADRIYLTDDNPRTEKSQDILKDIQVGITKHSDLKVIPNRAEAISASISEADLKDIILIAGKGHEDYQIIGHEKIPFSDHLHAQAALDAWQECRS